MAKLSKEMMELLKDPDTIKTLTTTDEQGLPHTVFKSSLTALDENTIAYMELLETCNSQRNILRNHWAGKLVSIALYNSKNNLSYQIKGKAVRFVNYGPIFSKFIDKVWSVLPQADPAGVWMIEPAEIINEDYQIRRKEEEERVLNQQIWRRFLGKRP
ncbi:MAG: pyridoxamine 5'-phosphate oxidase family protein [Thermodesulfobacteriota bacterium]|nr:pyridoxamine 5'-phosphate oxidase family protein [Thermodesulfobacteriota bacterium]